MEGHLPTNMLPEATAWVGLMGGPAVDREVVASQAQESQLLILARCGYYDSCH